MDFEGGTDALDSSSSTSSSSPRQQDKWEIPDHVREHIALHVKVSRARAWWQFLRRHTWDVLHVRASKYGHLTEYWPSRIVECCVVVLLLVHVALGAVFNDLVDSQRDVDEADWYRDLLKVHEIIWWTSTAVFTAEYLARLWSCVEEFESWRVAHTLVERHLTVTPTAEGSSSSGSGGGERDASAADAQREERADTSVASGGAAAEEAEKARGVRCRCCAMPPWLRNPQRRLWWAIKPLSLFDLFMVTMFYVPLFQRIADVDPNNMHGDEREVFETVSWFRLLLLLRLERQLKALKRVMQVVRQSQAELLSSCFFTIVTVLYTAVIFFLVERAKNEEIHSLLDALYWAVVTLTTLGYGDIAPVTPAGKVIGCYTCMMGMFSFAIPAGVVSASFVEVMYHEREKSRAKEQARRFLECVSSFTTIEEQKSSASHTLTPPPRSPSSSFSLRRYSVGLANVMDAMDEEEDDDSSLDREGGDSGGEDDEAGLDADGRGNGGAAGSEAADTSVASSGADDSMMSHGAPRKQKKKAKKLASALLVQMAQMLQPSDADGSSSSGSKGHSRGASRTMFVERRAVGVVGNRAVAATMGGRLREQRGRPQAGSF